MQIHQLLPCIPFRNCKCAGFRLFSPMGSLRIARAFAAVLLLIAAVNFPSAGQVTVNTRLSDSVLVGGQVVDLTLTVAETIDFYSASLEVGFDHNVLDFLGVDCTGLSEGGLRVAGQIGEGRSGVSVTRTTALTEPGQGDFMVMSFKVRDMAIAGTSSFTLSDLLIYDSGEAVIPTAEILPVSCRVAASITFNSLLIPEINEIPEGELFNVPVRLFASGVTGGERFSCQVGMGTTNTDPSSWDEAAWTDLAYDGCDEEFLLYFSGEAGFMKPPGEWYIASRASLDNGAFVYGGVHGIWHQSASPSGLLVILQRPPYRYTLAKWDFNNETLMPGAAIPVNRNAVFDIAGASISGFTTGASGLAVNSTGWKDGGDGSKFWFTAISTSGFNSIELSSSHYGSGTGPRDFAVGHSNDGMQWEPVDGGNITVATNWTSGRVLKLPLPPAAGNSEVLYLRWVMTSDMSISGGDISSTGTSRIDDVLVTGVNMNPETVTVYPGDTSNDGVVNADDVLPLGIFWLNTGPPATWSSTGFTPRTTEAWIPGDATFADANGDGIVDHKDLASIGFNFGKSTGPAKKGSTPPLSVLHIDPVEGGHSRRVMLVGESTGFMNGVAFSIEGEGIPAGMWEIKDIQASFAVDHPEEDIISFGHSAGGIFEGAVALKGSGRDVRDKKLARFELLIDQSWNDPFTLKLSRLSLGGVNPPGIVSSGGQIAFDGVTLAGGPDQGKMYPVTGLSEPVLLLSDDLLPS
jgi:hypothetical protein